ncbi:calmodulin-regulated spectrin-associated protein 2 [Bombina bombina]|uniref:calmodulin-regulated spectrin-associated protein 2 n=1 Tax=Bombina bombina TaxID=8345 RepID=UPI00235AF05B|nr:calmodulin-regulated spectrin-associated protein 2 [Bombina bombina]
MVDIAESGQEIKKTYIVPAIKPFDHYDFNRAKVASGLAWLVAKAFGAENVPEELQEPFYTDQYDQEHMKPPVVNLLLSADLYCRAGSLILKSDTAKPLLGHDAVIQALAQRGLYVTDREKLVTERDLRMKPIQMTAHLAMIDTLMMAYTVEMVSIEKVIACVHKYSPFFQATELPYDIEDAVTYWINKVNGHLKGIIEQEQRLKEQQNIDPSSGQKARYRKEHTLFKQLPCIPLMENILKDGTDGCAIAALLHFYCPELIRLEDICFKESMSLADSLYNLQLIQEFCQEYLNGCCHFTLEDMLYASSSVKANYLVFMAELFWWFEVVKPSFVQPREVNAQDAVQSMKNSSAPFSKRRNTMSGSSNCRNTQNMASSPGPASIRRSSSMSYVDGQIGTWPKEKRSSVHGVSFDISFDKDDGIRVTTPSRPIRRSISTEGFSLNAARIPKHIRKNLSFQPINGQGQSESIDEERSQLNHNDASSNQWDSDEAEQPERYNGPLETRISVDELDGQVEAPSIEEALKIIHNPERLPVVGDQVNNGFFLHSHNMNLALQGVPPGLTEENQEHSLEMKGVQSPATDNTEVDTGIHVPDDIPETMDEDSSLKDYTVSLDSDLDDPLKLHQDYGGQIPHSREPVSPCPSSVSGKSQAGSTASSSSGIKMTSFAEQKFRKLNSGDGRSSGSSSQKTTPEGSELNIPQVLAFGQAQEESTVPQSRDTTQLLASEVVQLRMKLEEKRRAIEAQKKKMEAEFTRQRQKMGRTAFLNVVKKKGDGISSLKEEAGTMESDKMAQESDGERETSGINNQAVKNMNLKLFAAQTPSKWLKSPTNPGETETSWSLTSPSEENMSEVELGEYTKSIEKLNFSLGFLQQEMQRLALQQDVLMQMREKQAWVISPPEPAPQRQLNTKPASKPSVTWSPIPCFSMESPRPVHRSPQTSVKKTVSFPPKLQRPPRPNELKITPLNRTLTPPQSVDSLPRLRRFSPSQIQTRSFVCFGDDRKPGTEAPEVKEQCVVDGGTSVTDYVRPDKALDSNQTCEKSEMRPIETSVSEVLSHPIVETVCVTPNDEQYSQRSFSTSKNVSLIEVPLSKLQPPDLASIEKNEDDTDKELIGEDQKVCCGFFFKDDHKEENDMAAKRAALLEKRLRRERENQQRKLEQELEQELKKEEARRKSEEERNKKEDEKNRREFIKQEYLRRKQLKLMEDMDSVIKPRSNLSKSRKPRPKSIHRELESPKTPTAVPPASSLSLASLNTGDNDSVHSGKRTPSPFRSESVEGYLSPGPCGSRNGEKDWENASTTSSVASATDYTGPKLYKEPSAKSNKYIIQNALAHCCLAGKVNESQKNKILEEMEKSNANNFLILFRDSGCQFRSLYTHCPETEEVNKLAGVGPKSISRKMIDGLYKYNSDRKQFSHIPAKTMSASVDAVTIHSHLWQAKRPQTPKKLMSPKA